MDQNNPTKPLNPHRPSGWVALSPLFVFLGLYLDLVTSLIVNDFYKVPITVAFVFASAYAVCLTPGLKLEERIRQFTMGAITLAAIILRYPRRYSR